MFFRHVHLPIKITLGREVVVELCLGGGGCVVGQGHGAISVFLSPIAKQNTFLARKIGQIMRTQVGSCTLTVVERMEVVFAWMKAFFAQQRGRA